MKVKSITLGYAARINVEGFEGVEPRVEVTAELEPGDDENTVKGQLLEGLKRDWNYLAQVIVGAVIDRRQRTPHKDQEFLVRQASAVLKALQAQSNG